MALALPSPFDLRALSAACRRDTTLAHAVLDRALERCAALTDRHLWIHLCDADDARAQLEAAAARLADGADLPLFGVPFAVKDNIDARALPTTAACPGFAYTPDEDAVAVERLREAGAILLGKTNMDQFATGLVGTRSPFGACACALDVRYISGGSSSGSALAVAYGAVSFALGTDTAGSGRVPAGFNNIVGLKPTRGLVSTRGVVPACRSLDCVSVFAGCVRDAGDVLELLAGFDARDSCSRRRPSAATASARTDAPLRCGVPRPSQREFCGDAMAARMYEQSIERLAHVGAVPVEIDFEPFAACARLLYETPFVAERYAAVGAYLEQHGEAADPTVAGIVLGARDLRAAELFAAMERLRVLARQTEETWHSVDALLLPTAPTQYTLAQVEAEPLALNSNLGHYTNFVNLLDLCALAVPAGMRQDGLPFGVTLVAPAFRDRELWGLADRLHRDTTQRIGATDCALTDIEPAPMPDPTLADDSQAQTRIELAVCGAHLYGQPLHHQLSERGAVLVERARTARAYRFFALDTTPPKPGLVYEPGFEGPGIEVEVWGLTPADFGHFVAAVPAPLAIGKVTLEDGREVSGFLCEPRATEGGREITELGGWREFVARG